jgi:amino acid transporter
MDSSSVHGGLEGLKNTDSHAQKAKLASDIVNDNYDGTPKRQHTAETPELVKNRSTLQVAFMSFVLASIPYGLSTTFIYPLYNGGPVTIIWGWLAVSLIIICVAASLGEITSVYPTAGGVYYQTFMLSPPRWRKLAAWTCGWAYVAGNILITLAVNFGSTTFLVGCINVFESEIGTGTLASETYQQFLIFVAITLVCNAVSAFGNRWLPLLDICSLVPKSVALIHN